MSVKPRPKVTYTLKGVVDMQFLSPDGTTVEIFAGDSQVTYWTLDGGSGSNHLERTVSLEPGRAFTVYVRNAVVTKKVSVGQSTSPSNTLFFKGQVQFTAAWVTAAWSPSAGVDRFLNVASVRTTTRQLPCRAVPTSKRRSPCLCAVGLGSSSLYAVPITKRRSPCQTVRLLSPSRHNRWICCMPANPRIGRLRFACCTQAQRPRSSCVCGMRKHVARDACWLKWRNQ
jgi:hypothetical protein